MTANEQLEPAAKDQINFLDILNGLLTVCLVCLTEFPLIRAYWFRQSVFSDPWRAFVLPFLVLFPGIVGFVFHLAIAKRGKKDRVDPSMLTWLNQSIGSLLVVTYIVIGILTMEITKALLH